MWDVFVCQVRCVIEKELAELLALETVQGLTEDIDVSYQLYTACIEQAYLIIDRYPAH